MLEWMVGKDLWQAHDASISFKSRSLIKMQIYVESLQ